MKTKKTKKIYAVQRGKGMCNTGYNVVVCMQYFSEYKKKNIMSLGCIT